MLLAPILAAFAQAPAAAPASTEPRVLAGREDDAALAQFRRLSPGERKDLADYFRLECSHLGTFQGSLVRFVLEEQERDPSAWPEDGPAPHYSSAEHTPENDIPRRVLAEDAPEVLRQKKLTFAGRPGPAFVSAWRYDYGLRELRRAKSWKDPERIFANGLRGISPDHDLARALVERALDDGSQRRTLAAFDHAYTDRDGNVYPGITLHDAWASGREIEMPDVDALGIVHDVLGDWTTWKAPVPSTRHDALYERIGELYAPAHVHRTLRRALAASYLEGSPADCEGYETYLDNLHTLWEDCRSTPEVLAKRLPLPEKRAEFFEAWTRTCFEKGELFQAGLARRKTLTADGEAVRALLLRILEEFGQSSDDFK
ncbi:MAG: hypothetical protein ACKVXR_14080 [Planctomycetota bacterium]